MNNEFKERFDWLMSLSNRELRKEIENSNWSFILQELRYAGETIEAYENMRKDLLNLILYQYPALSQSESDFKDDLLNILNKVEQETRT